MKIALNLCIAASLVIIGYLAILAYDYMTVGYGLHPLASAGGALVMVIYMFILYRVQKELASQRAWDDLMVIHY